MLWVLLSQPNWARCFARFCNPAWPYGPDPNTWQSCQKVSVTHLSRLSGFVDHKGIHILLLFQLPNNYPSRKPPVSATFFEPNEGFFGKSYHQNSGTVRLGQGAVALLLYGPRFKVGATVPLGKLVVKSSPFF